jgi:hypothetical protein
LAVSRGLRAEDIEKKYYFKKLYVSKFMSRRFDTTYIALFSLHLLQRQHPHGLGIGIRDANFYV